jgi:hypothetical protein
MWWVANFLLLLFKYLYVINSAKLLTVCSCKSDRLGVCKVKIHFEVQTGCYDRCIQARNKFQGVY